MTNIDFSKWGGNLRGALRAWLEAAFQKPAEPAPPGFGAVHRLGGGGGIRHIRSAGPGHHRYRGRGWWGPLPYQTDYNDEWLPPCSTALPGEACISVGDARTDAMDAAMKEVLAFDMDDESFAGYFGGAAPSESFCCAPCAANARAGLAQGGCFPSVTGALGGQFPTPPAFGGGDPNRPWFRLGPVKKRDGKWCAEATFLLRSGGEVTVELRVGEDLLQRAKARLAPYVGFGGESSEAFSSALAPGECLPMIGCAPLDSALAQAAEMIDRETLDDDFGAVPRKQRPGQQAARDAVAAYRRLRDLPSAERQAQMALIQEAESRGDEQAQLALQQLAAAAQVAERLSDLDDVNREDWEMKTREAAEWSTQAQEALMLMEESLPAGVYDFDEEGFGARMTFPHVAQVARAVAQKARAGGGSFARLVGRQTRALRIKAEARDKGRLFR